MKRFLLGLKILLLSVILLFTGPTGWIGFGSFLIFKNLKIVYVITLVFAIGWPLLSYFLDGIQLGPARFSPHDSTWIIGIPTLPLNLIRSTFFAIIGIKIAYALRDGFSKATTDPTPLPESP